ncbi:hypothetical protein D3C86_867510 [compost metagenome]
MYKIESIQINGFWGEFDVGTSLHADVNIFIGKNGTGKTTFMNILHAVLSVDPIGLNDNQFSEVKIVLADRKKRRTIKAIKAEDPDLAFPLVTYFISNHRFDLVLSVGDDVRSYSTYRRRTAEQANLIKEQLSEFVLLSSLSVYRFRQDPDAETRERTKRALSPVDSRLGELRTLLTRYQIELSMEARNISAELQKAVLGTLLYNPEHKVQGYSLAMNEDREKQNLIAAYRQLGLSGADIAGRIQKHIAAISATLKTLHRPANGERVQSDVDLAPLEARVRTDRVVELSLYAEKKIDEVYSQIHSFTKTLQTFIPEKTFAIEAGNLVAKAKNGTEIDLEKLSSGEKQLLILFIEALLQRQIPFVYLADEPELSLHISWQRKIISAIIALNPNAQIIVATHSPEIAGRFGTKIIDMEDILHG